TDGSIGAYRIVASLSNGVAPDISVRGNNFPIQDGDTTPSTSDGTNFGSMTVTAGLVTRTFHIFNQGSAELSLNGSPVVSITGAHASDFTVTAQPSATVAAGQFVEFQI